MKRKFSLTVLMLCIALCASAQIQIGGNIGISASSGSNSRIGVVIAPEIGYRVSPALTVGSAVTYRSLENSFGFTPYVRSTLVNVQDVFQFFLSFQAPLKFTSAYQSYGAFVRPGAALRIGPGVWMLAHIGAFGYSYRRESNGTGYGSWSARVNSNTINIGFCFSIGG